MAAGKPSLSETADENAPRTRQESDSKANSVPNAASSNEPESAETPIWLQQVSQIWNESDEKIDAEAIKVSSAVNHVSTAPKSLPNLENAVASPAKQGLSEPPSGSSVGSSSLQAVLDGNEVPIWLQQVSQIWNASDPEEMQVTDGPTCAIMSGSAAAGTVPPMGTGTVPPMPTGTNPPMGTGTNPPLGTGTIPPLGTDTNPPMGTGPVPPMPTNTYPPMGTGTNPPMGTGTNPPMGTGTIPPMPTTNPPMGTGTIPPMGTLINEQTPPPAQLIPEEEVPIWIDKVSEIWNETIDDDTGFDIEFLIPQDLPATTGAIDGANDGVDDSVGDLLEQTESTEPPGSAPETYDKTELLRITRNNNKISAFSKALERDQAWLNTDAGARSSIDAEILEREPEQQVAPALSRRESFSSTMIKVAKDIPAPKMSLFQKATEFVSKHPIPFGAGALAIVAVFAFVHLQSMQEASRQVQKGAELLASGDSKGAIAVLDKSLLLNQSPDAYLFRGRAFARLSQFDNAFDDYNRALKLDPRNTDAVYQCAKLSLSREQFKPAIAYFLKYLDLVHNDAAKTPDVYSGLGLAYMGAQQYPQALAQFARKNIEAKSGDAESLLHSAACYQLMQDPKEAIKQCTAALKIVPQSYDAVLMRARSYQLANDKEKALADFSRAMVLEPKNPSSFVYRGIFYAGMKDYNRAFQDFDKAIALNSKEYSAYIAKAKAYLSKGDPAGAEREYNTLSSLPGFKPDATYFAARGDFYVQTGKYTLAIAEFKKAQVKNPAQENTYALEMADCYGRLKQYSQALSLCNKVLLVEPLNSIAIMRHGQYSYLTGNKITGKADLFKAIELDPKNADAYMERGNYYLAEKQIYSASEDFARALRLNPDLAAASEKLALCQSQVKPTSPVHGDDVQKPALSKADLKEIAQADAQTLRGKGYTALKAGKSEYALAALSRAVQVDPNNALSRRYLAYALAKAGDGGAALQQFYAWEKLETVEANDAIIFAKTLLDCGAKNEAQALFEHLIAKYSTDAKVLLAVARACIICHFESQANAAIQTGVKVASDLEKVEFNKLKAALDHIGEPAPAAPVFSTGPHKA